MPTVPRPLPPWTAYLADLDGQLVAGRLLVLPPRLLTLTAHFQPIAVVRGSASPYAAITIMRDGMTLGRTTVPDNGAWDFPLYSGGGGILVATETMAGYYAPSATVGTLCPLPAPIDGVTTTVWSSSDLSFLLRAGDTPYVFRGPPQTAMPFFAGTESIQLVDGRLSVGTDTNEAFVERLYLGLLDRPSEHTGMAAWDGF